MLVNVERDGFSCLGEDSGYLFEKIALRIKRPAQLVVGIITMLPYISF